MLEPTNEQLDVDIDDIQSRYPEIKLTHADKQRILLKRRHHDFIKDLKLYDISYEDYLAYEARKSHRPLPM